MKVFANDAKRKKTYYNISDRLFLDYIFDLKVLALISLKV